MIKILLVLSVFVTSEIHAQQNYNKLNVKELDVTSRVNVISTTKSSKPCPVMTLVQRDAIATPLTGSCVYNSTDLQLNIYDGSLWQSAGGGGIENWGTATAYDVDDVVIESNKIYQCDIAHTSGTFATDLSGGNWIELSAQGNLTGVISSTGLATTITSQTGTGTTFVVQNTPTLTTPNIGAATGTSLTLAGNISAYNYDKDNMLINGNFENPLSSEWTCTVGTCSRTTASGEFSKDTAALKVVLSAQSMNVSQTVTTPSGIQKQGYVGFIYRIPASGIVTPTVTITVDSVLQVTVPTNKLIMDGLFHSLEVPITFGSTDVKISFLSGSSTGSVFFDGIYLKQGIGLQNLQGDYLYSAKISAAGVITDETSDFITTCSASAGKTTCQFVSGRFTVVPNCWAITRTSSGGTISENIYMDTSNYSTTEVAFKQVESGSASSDAANLFCMKSGNDYLSSSSSNVYSQANQNVSALYTGAPPTGTLAASFNTVTFGTKVKDTHNAYSSGTYTVPVSASYSISVGVAVTGTYNGAQGLIVGIHVNGTNKYQNVNVPTNSAGRAWVNLSVQSISLIAGDLVTIKVYNDGTGLSYESNATTNYFSIARSDSNVISGSFENVPNVPGAGARIDTFSVSYGAANVGTPTATNCTTGSCILDQIGTAISSIAFNSTGNYTMTSGKTYSKLKCVLNAADSSNASVTNFSETLTCLTCSSLVFKTRIPVTGQVNSHGTMFCMGSY